ncbi:MAG: DUF3465 domain-containing protein [Burkholderiales bacterium]|nr:DUF3465 domain-containing protein [Burkholderiales bacterium]
MKLAAIGIVAVAAAIRLAVHPIGGPTDAPRTAPGSAAPRTAGSGGASRVTPVQLLRTDARTAIAVGAAHAAQAADVLVDGTGHVTRLLPDDTVGDRHQRFLVDTDGGPRVLIVHNIDVAPRVAPLAVGDPVRFRGEYVWNDKGGLVHWTHHDPRGRHTGGWIEVGGRRFD